MPVDDQEGGDPLKDDLEEAREGPSRLGELGVGNVDNGQQEEEEEPEASGDNQHQLEYLRQNI